MQTYKSGLFDSLSGKLGVKSMGNGELERNGIENGLEWNESGRGDVKRDMGYVYENEDLISRNLISIPFPFLYCIVSQSFVFYAYIYFLPLHRFHFHSCTILYNSYFYSWLVLCPDIICCTIIVMIFIHNNDSFIIRVLSILT